MNVYQVNVSRQAQRDLDRLEEGIYQRILQALRALANDPRPHGGIKLAGGGYRVRVGDYWAVYDIDDEVQVVTVLRIKHRRDVYKER